MKKKAELGVGTLIIFIALLLTATIAATVLIQTTGSLQERSLTTGDRAVSQVSTGVKVIDISGTDGTTRTIKNLTQIIKLTPGADPVKLDSLLLTIALQDKTATLEYRNGTTKRGLDGYLTVTEQEIGELGNYYENVQTQIDDFTPVNLNIDLDLDGGTDRVVVCRNGRPYCDPAYADYYIMFNLSTGGIIYVQAINSSGQPLNLGAGLEDFGNSLTAISNYGYMTLTGTASGGWRINPGQMHLYLKPTKLEQDLDGDRQQDELVINDTHVIIHYSTKGNISQQLENTGGVAYPLGVNLGTGPQTINTTITLTDNESSQTFGKIIINGTTTRASYIDEPVTFKVIPQNIGHGYYTIEYVQRGSNSEDGRISPGDIIRLYYESPRAIGEDEKVIISLIPKAGSITRSEFYTPSIINKYSEHLYP